VRGLASAHVEAPVGWRFPSNGAQIEGVSQPETGAQGESAEQLHPGLEDVVGYRDGDLFPSRMAAVEEHLAGCAPCRERLAAAEAVLAEVDLIAEQPLFAESLEVELMLERLRLAHVAAWQAGTVRSARSRFEIRSRLGLAAGKVEAMAKAKRKAAASDSGVDAAFALWGSGDLRSARAMARALLANGPAEGDRIKLERLIADTSPDPRALHIAVFCLAVVGLVTLLTKLFG
jgi:Putative zinc-finger